MVEKFDMCIRLNTIQESLLNRQVISKQMGQRNRPIFLPDLKVIDVVLRNTGTSFNLPYCSYKLYKQSFVNRCLSRDCY